MARATGVLGMSIWVGIACSVGCGGRATSVGSGLIGDGNDAQVDATVVDASGGDATLPDRTCVSDDDCVAVLDYRNGFICLAPTAASRQAVAGDACLVPWKPNPRCTTQSPPLDCPGGPVPVDHSCFVTACAFPRCKAGTCSLDFPLDCPAPDAGPPDCAALLATYRSVLAEARVCDPTKGDTSCQGDYADGCGCEVPYDLSGPYANATMCAFEAWTGAGCHIAPASCGTFTCVVPTSAGASCVANASGTTGTCEWKQ